MRKSTKTILYIPADHSPGALAVRSPPAILAQTTVQITILSYSLLFNSNSQECAGITAETSVVTGSNDWGPPWGTQFWALHSTVRCAGVLAVGRSRGGAESQSPQRTSTITTTTLNVHKCCDPTVFVAFLARPSRRPRAWTFHSRNSR